MKPLLIAGLAILLSAPVRAELSPAGETFLKSIGVNLQAQDVVVAIADGVISTTYDADPQDYSLDDLATRKQKNGSLAFIGTRNFIKKLKGNFSGTSIPSTNYDPLYLTPEERSMAGRKFAERFKKK
jgi:hypothetical protein